MPMLRVERGSDALMYFVAKGSDPVAAESTSELTPDDKLTADFKAGRHFAVDHFSLGLSLLDTESSGDKPRTFARWRAMKQAGVKPSPPYRAEPADFWIARAVDTASPILLQWCLEMQRLDKGVLVKRRRVGAGAMTGVLRLEFTKLLIKSVDWGGGTSDLETFRLQFATVNVTYLKQKPDGSTASSWPAKWEG